MAKGSMYPENAALGGKGKKATSVTGSSSATTGVKTTKSKLKK